MQPRESFTSVFFRGHMYSFGGCQLHQFCYNDVFIMNINENCPSKCSGNGVCKKELGCACNIGFTEHDCSMKTKCKKDCSNHGFCHNNAKCGCFPGFTGPHCEVNLNCPKNCTSIDNGYCALNSTCVCKLGYTGPACDKLSSNDIKFFKEKSKKIVLDTSVIKNITNKKNKNNTLNNKTSKIKLPKAPKHSKLKHRLKSFEIKLENYKNNTLKQLLNSSNQTVNLKTQHINKLINDNKNKSEKLIEKLVEDTKIPIFLQKINHSIYILT